MRKVRCKARNKNFCEAQRAKLVDFGVNVSSDLYTFIEDRCSNCRSIVAAHVADLLAMKSGRASCCLTLLQQQASEF
jgi:hypothetical protein